VQAILNADDFGYSSDINQAVMRAHKEGVLTSASLMVSGRAFKEAVELAREAPSLAVGLHLVVASGPAVLSHDRLPHILDEDGCFPNTPVRLGLRYLFSRAAQRELAQELTAQFDRFAATGLPLSHVDGHVHMHLHPVVFKLILPLAERYGARAIRVPRDDLWLSLRCDRRKAGAKVTWAIIFSLLSRWCVRQMQGCHLLVADRVYGLMQSGHMQVNYVVEVLRRLDVPVAELFFHPTVGTRLEELGPNPGDLATLLSPAVRRVIEERGIRLTHYLALAGG